MTAYFAQGSQIRSLLYDKSGLIAYMFIVGKGGNIMLRKLSRLGIAAMALALLVSLISGCFLALKPEDFIYRGDHPEILTVAMNAILGTPSYFVSEIVEFPEIIAVEADDYGRTLYIYSDNDTSLIISQHSDDEYVYFYPHYCFISIDRLKSGRSIGYYHSNPPLPIEDIEESFTPEAIEELKSRNDWNLPMNLDNAIRAQIVNIKPDRRGPVDDDALSLFYESFFEEKITGNRVRPKFDYFKSDDYGRSIYSFGGVGNRYFVVLFQPDGTFEQGVMELSNRYQYQDELKAFMELSGWDMPPGTFGDFPLVWRTERYDDYSDGSFSITEYRLNGNKIIETRYHSDGTLLKFTEYDIRGNIAKVANYISDGTIRINEYDTDGNNVKYTAYKPDGTLEFFTMYDAEGNTVKSTYYYPDGSVAFVFDYDTEGNKSIHTRYYPDGTIESVSEYDAEGELVNTTFFD